jgi:hypothetical protein
MLKAIGHIPSDLELVKTVLTWLLYSARPLRLDELAVAVAIKPGKDFDGYTQKLDYDEIVLETCSSFVKMNVSTRTVEIAHISVAEYFASALLSDGVSNENYIDEKTGHSLLMKSCLTYLSSPPFKVGPCVEYLDVKSRIEDEFWRYAAYYWPVHAEKVEYDVDDRGYVHSFLRNAAYFSWGQCLDVYELKYRG